MNKINFECFSLRDYFYTIIEYLYYASNIFPYRNEAILWHQELNKFSTFLYFVSITWWVYLLFPILGVIIILSNNADWRLMLFFGGISVVAFGISALAAVKANDNIEYIITDKRIRKTMGAMNYEVRHKDIKKIKIKRSIFNKNNGTIKIYIKKGISLNYHLANVKGIGMLYEILGRYHEI